MMKTIYKNEFVEINSDDENKYIETIYLETSTEMSDTTYKELVLKGIELFNSSIVSYNKYLADFRFLNYAVHPDVQIWVANESKRMKFPDEYKYATILSSELITMLSIEQTIDEVEVANQYQPQMRYFEDVEKAKEWLFE